MTDPPAWVAVHPVTAVISRVPDDLDPGERAAIALDETVRADLLLSESSGGPWSEGHEGRRRSARGDKRERAGYSRYAKATFRRELRLNIPLSSRDPEAIQKRALAERWP
jgi:hypothetical protein